MGSRILRPPEVVEEIGVSKASLYRWIRSGRFPPPIKLGPRRVGWRREDVDAWIAGRPNKGSVDEDEALHEPPLP
ncbi:MAG: AlpA family phage regulatory protein [Gemmatimonadota bacterium]|nr:AlpA family phage regulatory protein [Gemmatimonadota bacterium]